MKTQSAPAVFMVRPSRFFPNPETAADNAFQSEMAEEDAAVVSQRALAEFDAAAKQLRDRGVTVHVFDDTPTPAKPDAVFPNNWFSTHHDGRVALYPMFSPARRHERRRDLVERLREFYEVREIVDYAHFEKENLFLEGTGSLVLDHVKRVAYVSLSKRAHREMVERFCADFSYRPIMFESFGDDGRAIYHTNVMMCIGTEFSLLGTEMIRDAGQRERILAELAASGREIILLTRDQIGEFAGNAIELQGNQRKLVVLSARAHNCLTSEQRAQLTRFAELVPLSLPTIELAGGSARCMLATIHLPPRR